MRISTLFVAAAAIAAAAGDASAGVKASCKLDRSPFLLQSAMPADLACAFDEDGNGLDDEIEQQIAECFVPELRFDREENATRNLGVPCAKRGDAGFDPKTGEACSEPHPIYTMIATSPKELQLRYSLLWARDGGTLEGKTLAEQYPAAVVFGPAILAFLPPHWVEHGIFTELNTAHPGDSQSAFMGLSLEQRPSGWFVEIRDESALAIAGDQPEPKTAASVEFSGTHPVIYLAAGKHHQYRQRYDRYEWSGEVVSYIDRVRGDISYLPRRIDHGPLLQSSGAPATAGTIGDDFVNACAASRGDSSIPATRFLRGNSLADLGYPEDTLDQTSQFKGDAGAPCSWPCVGRVDPPTTTIGITADAGWANPDGDGQPNARNWMKSEPLLAAFDRCPWAASDFAFDVDGDQIVAECDPDGTFASVYVAGGAPDRPTVSDRSPKLVGVSSWRGSPRGGFLDRDGDAIPDGEDTCPLDAASRERDGGANARGEVAAFPPPVGTDTRSGIFHRGDYCDPNPVAVPKVDTGSGTGSGLCKAGKKLALGADQITITQHATRGISHNGPSPAIGEWVDAQTYRCGCRSRSTGNPIENATECLESPDSECYFLTLTEAPAGARGHGWVPVYRPDCSGPTCGRYKLPIKERVVTPTDIIWDWRRELAMFPPSSGTAAHFDTADFDVTLTKSEVPYVFWTQTYPEAGLGVPTTSGGMPDPELVPGFGFLQTNLIAKESLALRAGFSRDVYFLAAYHEVPFSGVDCPGMDWLIDKIIGGEWKSPYGPGPCPAPDDLFGTRVVASRPGDTLPSGGVFAPATGETRAIELAYWDPRFAWVYETPGAGVLVTAPPAALDANDAASCAIAVEPDVLWLEQTMQGARWVRLRPVGAGSDHTIYDVVAEGVVDVPFGPDATLVQDAYGESAAIVDPSAGLAAWFDPTSGTWTAMPMVVRHGATMRLQGGTLIVAGGVDEHGQFADTMIALDLAGGEPRFVAHGIPPRWDARLVDANDGSGRLLFVGGFDPQGWPMDDVHAVHAFDADAPPHAEMILPPTQRGSLFVPALVTSDAGQLLGWGVNYDTGRFEHRVRTPDGWVSAAAEQ